mmetsp:Transcript_21301/g.50261  ORF Transcript_21301/g.50261 Transcript_21301/m.50261 type:complete len:224 (-) Transcript_21301:68-739(-)
MCSVPRSTWSCLIVLVSLSPTRHSLQSGGELIVHGDGNVQRLVPLHDTQVVPRDALGPHHAQRRVGLVEADDGLVQHVLLLPAPSGLALPEHGQRDNERRRSHEGLVDVGGPDLAQVVVDGGGDGAVLVRGQDVVQVGLGGILLELDVEAHPNGTVGYDNAGTALGLALLLVPSCRGIGVGRTAANLGHASEGGGRGHDCAGRHPCLFGFGLLLFDSVLCPIV